MTSLRKVAGLLGIAAFVIFWAATFVFGALRPSYSHISNTISELGAIGTPNALGWNVVGFIAPGLMLAFVGGVTALTIVPENSWRTRLAAVLLVITGLAIAGQGIFPADMADGVADVTSPNTRAHFLSSLISGPAWAISIFLLAGPMKQSIHWRGWRIVSIVFVVLTFAAAFVLRVTGSLPAGLAERTGGLFLFVWFLLTSIRLLTSPPAQQNFSSQT